MKSQVEILEILRNVKEEYKDSGIDIIGVFGSVAKQTNTTNSDIDILYDTQKGVQNLHDKKQTLKNKLQNLFHTKVDLASKKYIKPYVKNEIMKDLIYV